MTGPAKTHGNGQLTGEVAVRATGDGERAATVPAGEKAFVLLFDEGESATACAENEPDASADGFVRDIKPGLLLRLGRCRQRQRHDPRQTLQFRRRQHALGIELLRRDLPDAARPQPFIRLACRSLESAGTADARVAERFTTNAVGRNAADTGDEGPREQRPMLRPGAE